MRGLMPQHALALVHTHIHTHPHTPPPFLTPIQAEVRGEWTLSLRGHVQDEGTGSREAGGTVPPGDVGLHGGERGLEPVEDPSP